MGETISVAASDLSTKFNSTDRIVKDGFYTFSNLGSCVDIFAPGGTSQALTCEIVRLHGAKHSNALSTEHHNDISDFIHAQCWP